MPGKCSKCDCNLITAPEVTLPPDALCSYCRIAGLEAQVATLKAQLAEQEGEVSTQSAMLQRTLDEDGRRIKELQRGLKAAISRGDALEAEATVQGQVIIDLRSARGAEKVEKVEKVARVCWEVDPFRPGGWGWYWQKGGDASPRSGPFNSKAAARSDAEAHGWAVKEGG